jgi:hypothetical protein
MKKIFVLAMVLTLLAAAASAQGPGDRTRRQRVEQGFNNGQLTRPERFRLQKDRIEYKVERRRAARDGRITPMERRRLSQMRRHDRHEAFRFKHNRRRRIL